MYRCDSCRNCVEPRTSCKRVVTKKVNFLHPERLKAKKGFIIQNNGKKKKVWLPDHGGWGYQIVSEAKMCPDCALKWEKSYKQVMV